MKQLNVPETFADVLLLIQAGECISWSRDLKCLSVTIDDKVADRRSCIDIRFDRLSAVVRTLCGYDAVKHRWSEYVGGEVTSQFPDRRGEKRVREWITEQALKLRQCPNPEAFTFYRHPAKA